MTSGSALLSRRPKHHAKLLEADRSPAPEIAIALAGLGSNPGNARWLPLGTCLAHFDCNTWLKVIRQHISFPERNSSNILRANILSETEESIVPLPFTSATSIRRKLLPRRPNLDGHLFQTCSIYRQDLNNALVVYTQQTEKGLPIQLEQIPFYHPKVRSIAFQYRSRNQKVVPSAEKEEEEEDLPEGDVFIYIVPFACNERFNASQNPSHRLSRTILMLLDHQALHSWGSKHNYRKRVIHDTLVPREEYMDLYLILKERYASTIINKWALSTDPLKHVFEDIGIAAFLILLWKETYMATGEKMTSFVDVGCGNGLLVHLLNAEGYQGFGFDLQERKSWQVWKDLPGGADLRTISLDAPAMVENSDSLFPPGSFLIGNHADELTSWIPLLAHSIPEVYGFVNIPCCLYRLNGDHFGDMKHDVSEQDLSHLLGRSKENQTFQFTQEQIERGPPPAQGKSTSTTRNTVYLKYLSHLHLQAGWHLEKEALRIPSTKNWALVGRRRVWQSCLFAIDDQVSIEIAQHLQETTDRKVKSMAAQSGQKWEARLSSGKGIASSGH